MRKTGSKIGWLFAAASLLIAITMTLVTLLVLKGKVEGSENPEDTGYTGQDVAADAELVSESELKSETKAPEAAIQIENLNAYFSYAPWYEAAFTECLTNYANQKELDAAAATVFYASVPEEEPDSMQYYVQLNDSMQTIVILTWHQNEKTVTASQCSFTKEDVLNECWNNIQPAERDITPEEEAAFLEQQTEALFTEKEGADP